MLFLRGRDADGRIQHLVAERRALRLVLGTLALPLVKRRGYEGLGFRSLGDYVRERLGVTAQVVRDWARGTEALAALPRLRAAVLSGEVSWSVAQRAVRHASPESDADFAQTLRGRTVRAAEDLLEACCGARKHEDTEQSDRVRVSVPLPTAERGRWLAALELARRMAGESLPVWECAEAIAAEALAAIPPAFVAQAASGNGMPPPRAGRMPAPRRKAAGHPSREHGLRHEAFAGMHWPLSGAGAEAFLERLGAWAATASPHALDRALRRAMRRLQRIDHDLGHILRQLIDRRLHCELGFVSFERYVEERVEVSPRTARRWVRMARLGPLGGAVARALRAGSLSPKQADIVLHAVLPAKQAEAVAFAQGVTLRRLEDEHSESDHGAVSFTAPPEAANVFWLALEAARLHLRAGASEALLWMLEHALEAWAAQGAQFDDYADFQRDRFRCTAPGCTARRNLQSHHIVFCSHGGPDEAWNRTTLCAFHHLRGIHARTLSCRGRAPEGLVFELGLRAQGGPLLQVGAGEVILGRGAREV